MSAGPTLEGARYESNNGIVFPIRIQPETITLNLNSVTNALPSAQVTLDVPSARVGAGRNSFGVNARLVRITFTAAVPPGYLENGVITLPVLTLTAYNAYTRGTTGTYNLNGTDYAVKWAGRSPEKIN